MPVLAGIDIVSALGFGCFLAWQNALVTFLFPPSAGLVFSPVVCQAFACCLLSAVALLGLFKNRGGFSVRALRAAVGGSCVAGTLAAILVSSGVAGHVGTYVASVTIGCACAVPFYAWAEVFADMCAPVRGGVTVTAGLLVASVLQYVVGLLSVAVLAMNLSVALAGVLALGGFFASAGRVRSLAAGPLIFRPASSNHFKLLLAAIVLFAFAFGSVSGTTANMATEEMMRTFNMRMALVVCAVSLALLAVSGVLARRREGADVHLQSVGRVLAPTLAVLFLLHILFKGNAGGWLPIATLGFWQYVQLFVFLLLIEISKSGYSSLSFIFPLGWSVVAAGFAVGALFGQAASVVFGVDDAAVESISALLTIVAVVASSMFSAARYPQVATDLPDVAPDDRTGGEAAPGQLQRVDPIGDACSKLVERNGLSGREEEVFDLLARGNTRASIADKLCISENTVRVHVKNIYAKLRVHSKQQLIDMVDKVAQQG